LNAEVTNGSCPLGLDLGFSAEGASFSNVTKQRFEVLLVETLTFSIQLPPRVKTLLRGKKKIESWNRVNRVYVYVIWILDSCFELEGKPKVEKVKLCVFFFFFFFFMCMCVFWRLMSFVWLCFCWAFRLMVATRRRVDFRWGREKWRWSWLP